MILIALLEPDQVSPLDHVPFCICQGASHMRLMTSSHMLLDDKTLPVPRLMLYVIFKAYIYVEFCEGGIYMESGLDKQPFCLE